MSPRKNVIDNSLQVKVLLERVNRIEKAIEVKAVEYERRLEDLNHEASRISMILAQSVTAEKFEDYKSSTSSMLKVLGDDTAARVNDLQVAVQELKAEDRLFAQQGTDSLTRKNTVLRWQIVLAGSATAIFVVFLGFLLNTWTLKGG